MGASPDKLAMKGKIPMYNASRGVCLWLWLLTLTLTFTVWSCGADNDAGRNSSELVIVTTTGMIGDLAEHIGGGHVTVTSLMGPGVDPHLYKASEGDVGRMSGADLILYNGLHLEGAMSDLLKRLADRIPTVAVASGIDDSLLLTPPEFEGNHDPHIWFDVSLWMHAADRVASALVEHDPAHSESYLQSLAAYHKQLTRLHHYVQDVAATVPPEARVLVTAHDAFNYFGRAYGFEVKGLQGISTATEAGTADVQALAEYIAEQRIPAMFVESSVPPRSIQAVQEAVRARGFQVQIGGELFSDAMGEDGTAEGTYVGMISHNIETIAAALKGL
jgi:manganese/zinc/iron transport system substrate-binding protein